MQITVVDRENKDQMSEEEFEDGESSEEIGDEDEELAKMYSEDPNFVS